ncbi:unnamed protein product [Blepharisma stoltei]|uniref:Uncharacterized protein n=1 Tax=Blepharisma stoltei TaxID=1481888 RepID=A0AAU9J234_9CILI|nr:unnamed protein product [Blepharisma stoltei]
MGFMELLSCDYFLHCYSTQIKWKKFPWVSFLRFLAWLADYLMPILGNLCFVPFISMCLNVFVCDQSIG